MRARVSTQSLPIPPLSPSLPTLLYVSFLPVEVLGGEVAGDGHLPLVPVRQQLLLVVQQLLVRLRGPLEVGALHDGVHGARLLAEAAEDALAAERVCA